MAMADDFVMTPIVGPVGPYIAATCKRHPGYGVSFPAQNDPEVSLRRLLEELRLHLLSAHEGYGLIRDSETVMDAL